MGSVGRALNPMGDNFLGLGKGVGRIAGDVATGGLAEFGRGDSFGLPPGLAGPLKIGAGTIGGGMLGGPAGSFLGGTLGGALGGNTTGGMVGGGIGGLLQSLIAGGGGGGGLGAGNLALGGSLLGLGLSQDTSVPDVSLNPSADTMSATNGSLDRLRGLYGQQNDLLGQRMQAQRDSLMRQLTTGQEGEAFRQKYNNLGLLNSGAFNQGLSNQFSNLADQQQQDMLGLGIDQTGGLASRMTGMEDLGTQMSLARSLAQAQQKSQLQQSLLGLSGRVLGGGMGGGGSGGGGGGGLFGGDTNFLSSLASGTGNLISNLLGRFRGGPKGLPLDTPFPQGDSQMNPGFGFGGGGGGSGLNLF